MLLRSRPTYLVANLKLFKYISNLHLHQLFQFYGSFQVLEVQRNPVS